MNSSSFGRSGTHLRDMCYNYQEGGEGLRNELHIGKYYVVPYAKEGKFSPDPIPDPPKIMTSSPPPRVPMDGTLCLLANSYNEAQPS